MCIFPFVPQYPFHHAHLFESIPCASTQTSVISVSRKNTSEQKERETAVMSVAHKKFTSERIRVLR